MWSRSCRSPCRLPSTRAKRLASTKNPFPYPSNTKPTPSQIFHLPRNASPEDIKARYFELVRIYHPDSPISQSQGLNPEIVRMRFHSITSAYARLLRRERCVETASDAHDLAKARWKATKARRYEFLDGGGFDDRWKEWILVGSLVFTAIVFVVQGAWSRHHALAEATARRRRLYHSDTSQES